VTTILDSRLKSGQFDDVTLSADCELLAFPAARQTDSGEIPIPDPDCYCNGIF